MLAAFLQIHGYATNLPAEVLFCTLKIGLWFVCFQPGVVLGKNLDSLPDQHQNRQLDPDLDPQSASVLNNDDPQHWVLHALQIGSLTKLFCAFCHRRADR